MSVSATKGLSAYSAQPSTNAVWYVIECNQLMLSPQLSSKFSTFPWTWWWKRVAWKHRGWMMVLVRLGVVIMVVKMAVKMVVKMVIMMVLLLLGNNFFFPSFLPVYGDLGELRGHWRTIQKSVVRRYSERRGYYTLHHVNIYYRFQCNFALHLTGLNPGAAPLGSLELCVFYQWSKTCWLF